jgi:hypothetical protein
MNKTNPTSAPVACHVKGVILMNAGTNGERAVAPLDLFWSLAKGESKGHLMFLGQDRAICGVAVDPRTERLPAISPDTMVCSRCAALCRSRESGRRTR